MRCLAYSDIHHDEYTNGITLEDTVAVEHAVTEYALQHGIRDVILDGDWFRATNPKHSVMLAAEAAIKTRCDAGVNTRAVVGNHDRFTKSPFSGHAFAAAGIYTNDLSKLYVYEQISIFNIDDVTFVAIPSGHEVTQSLVDAVTSRKSKRLVVLFHGLVVGSALAGGVNAASGVDPAMLKMLPADLYIGGDNHTPQRLDHLLGKPSFYCGAPMHHNWGDAGQVRGWWDINIDDNGVYFALIPSHAPRFVKLEVRGDTYADVAPQITSMLASQLDSRPGIVDIEVSGCVVDQAERTVFEELAFKAGARQVRVKYDVLAKQSEQFVSMIKSHEDRWANFVGKSDLKNNFNPAMLVDYGRTALQQAKRGEEHG